MNNRHVGPLYCRAERWPRRMLPPDESVTVSMPTGQTDRRQTVTLRF